MRTNRSSQRQFFRHSGQGGYTLVEMMVSILVSLIIIGAIYTVFNSEHRSSLSQKNYNDLQTSCTFALDQMKNEITLAGFHAKIDAKNPISVAAADTITFEYYDDNASSDTPYSGTNFTKDTQVTFRRATAAESPNIKAGDLVREFMRYNGATTPGIYTTQTKQALASNIQSLSFSYLAGDNVAWTGGDRSAIRAVRISLTCNAAKPDPVRNTTPTITLTAEVRARNIGIASTPKDVTAPDVPVGLRVWDPEECGKLKLRWNANSDPDLQGYTIHYGLLSGGVYTNRVRVTRGPQAAGGFEEYTVEDLDSTIVNCLDPTATPAKIGYHFAISAFDKSGNQSNNSADEFNDTNENHTNPGTTVYTSITSDTTIDPQPLSAPNRYYSTAVPPVDMTVTMPAANQLRIEWTPPADVTGLIGYRLYRGDAPGFVPSGLTKGAGNCIKDESELKATSPTFFLDENLPGCVTVYYKLAAINCDQCRDVTTLNFLDLNGAPTDSTKPPAPEIFARAGYQRVILTLKNPIKSSGDAAAVVTPDFKETRVFFNTVPAAVDAQCVFPSTIPNDGTVPGMQLIPDSGGIFTTEGTVPSINFDDVDEEVPGTGGAGNLDLNLNYCFLAVAYDQCSNASSATDDKAQDVGKQCGDCEPGEECFGAPANAFNNFTKQGCYGSLTLNWDHIDPVGIIQRDFTGYRVYRCDHSANSCLLTTKPWEEVAPEWELLTGAEPVWFSTFQDTTDKGLANGALYRYKIVATDCYWEQWHGKPQVDWPDQTNDPNDNISEMSPNVEEVSVGNIELETTPPIVLSGNHVNGTATVLSADFQHNTVLFRTKNTAKTPLSLKQLKLTWTNTQAYLQKFLFGDDDTTDATIGWEDTSPTLTTTSGIPASIALYPALKVKADDANIPFDLTFKTQSAAVLRTASMREDSLDYTLYYRNDSTGDESCFTTGTLPVPLGPYVFGTSQNQPQTGTLAWPVPGDAGNNTRDAIPVPGKQNVTVYASVYDTSLVGIREVKLFYHADFALTELSAPAPVGAYPNYTNYTTVPMTRIGSSNQYYTATPIPEQTGENGASVWYFVVAVDNNGNFDREPEIRDPDTVSAVTNDAFQYRQLPEDVCENTPEAPVIEIGIGFSEADPTNGVKLTWWAPEFNTSSESATGTPLTDLAGFRIWRWPLNGTPEIIDTVAAVPATEPPTPYIWPSSGNPEKPLDIDSRVYSYFVTAIDTCPSVAEPPGPRESARSNIFTECVRAVGASSCVLTLTENRADSTKFQPGDSFTIKLFECEEVNKNLNNKLYVQTCSALTTSPGADTDTVLLAEENDTGNFNIEMSLDPAQDGVIKTWSPSTYPPTSTAKETDLKVDNSTPTDDVITVNAWKTSGYNGGWGDCLSPPHLDIMCSATITVPTTYVDPCTVTQTAPTFPNTPAFTAVPSGSPDGCTSTTPTVTLTWPAATAPTNGEVTKYTVFRCKTGNNASSCDPFASTTKWDVGSTALTYNDTSVTEVLKKTSNPTYLYFYGVQAVNAKCVSNVKTSNSSPVTPCP